MDADRARMARTIVIILGTGLCAFLSWFFTMIGAMLHSSGGFSWETARYTIWGIGWGALCGFRGTDALIQRILQQRYRQVPIGLIVGLLVGGVNGLLTMTLPFGLVIGAVLGPVAALILEALFRWISKVNNKI